jgi:transposase
MAVVKQHPDLALGFADECWWSREQQPSLRSWSDDQSLRLIEQNVPATDNTSKALACYGLFLPAHAQMLVRFVTGRPVSVITEAFLTWVLAYLATQGKRALFLIWDNATWHRSQSVRQWIQDHNRRVKQEGGCRLIVCRLPTKSPWLNPIEPKWVHGKRAVVEPTRLLSLTELMQRICTYYHCELLEPLAKPDC